MTRKDTEQDQEIRFLKNRLARTEARSRFGDLDGPKPDFVVFDNVDYVYRSWGPAGAWTAKRYDGSETLSASGEGAIPQSLQDFRRITWQ